MLNYSYLRACSILFFKRGGGGGGAAAGGKGNLSKLEQVLLKTHLDIVY